MIARTPTIARMTASARRPGESWVRNARDSPAPLQDIAGRLRWWARAGARRARRAAVAGPSQAGSAGPRFFWRLQGRIFFFFFFFFFFFSPPLSSGSPASSNPTAPAPRSRSSPQTPKVAAATPPASVPGPRAAGSGHPRSCQPTSPPPTPVRTCCGHRLHRAVARIRTYPATGGQADWPSAGAWLPGSWEALFKGSGSDLRDPRRPAGGPGKPGVPPPATSPRASRPGGRAGRQKGRLQCGHRRIGSHPRGERAV